MPASNKTMMRRLQIAINQKGHRILIDKPQFYSDEQRRPVTLYRVCKSMPNPNGGKSKKETLFDTTSQIQVVLFLRDYWYWINGWEIPADNDMWNEVKAKKNIVFGELG